MGWVFQCHEMDVYYKYYDCDSDELPQKIVKEMLKKTRVKNYPRVFVGRTFVKDTDNIIKLKKSGELQKLFKQYGISFIDK